MNIASLGSLIGFIAALGAGIVLIVIGATNAPPEVRAIVWGAWAVVSTVLAWISGAAAKPKIFQTKPLVLGADVTRIPLAPWLIIAGLFVVAVVVSFIAF